MIAPRIGLITCREIPEPDADQDLLLDALRAAGAEPRLIPWDGPEGAGTECDLLVLRSAWNYFEAPERFESWLAAAAARGPLWNPLPVLRWNLRKTYLRQLERQGIAIVPTRWIERGAPAELGALLAETGWSEIVVKPTVSAGSFLTRRFAAAERREAEEFIARAGSGREWMVQRYLPSVESSGERAIVAIDGAVSHAVRKTSRFAGEPERVSAALEPSPDERMFAERSLGAVGAPLLYARVDVIPDETGALRLAELELLEPSLFLRQHPPALERFVAAILARVPR